MWWQIETDTAIDCLDRCKAVNDLYDLIEPENFGLTRFKLVLEYNDLVACAVAAGILRITPGRLPAVGDVSQAWEYYLAAWRPGKPRPERWPEAYKQALLAWPFDREVLKPAPWTEVAAMGTDLPHNPRNAASGIARSSERAGIETPKLEEMKSCLL
ncbi:MAG: hypothetical protein LC776_01385 [Acidobacteria bacterium]|nr:hypothetical protein [Acidobacteriota bacterium]